MKTILSILLCTLLNTMYAQRNTTTLNNDVSIGLVAGFDLTNLNGKDANGDKLKNKLQPAFHIGANVEIPIADEFYVQPNIIFARKGAKVAQVTGLNTTTRIRISYIDVPINLVYKGVVGNNYVMLGGGPYIAFGIGGKIKTTGSNTTVERSLKFKSNVTATEVLSDVYLKRLDAGANFFFGYGLTNNITVQLNTQLGLVNISPSIEGVNNDKETLKNTNFGLSIGYRF
jgi:hypothetical protein